MTFWDALESGIPCCVPVNCVVKKNGELVMGAGLAKSIAQRISILPMMFGWIFSQKGPGVYLTSPSLQMKGEVIIARVLSFPTKVHFSNPSDMHLIADSAKSLVRLADEQGIKTIFLPKVGCGLGGLRWSDVSSVLEEILDARFMVPEIIE